jgi:hypothetical protein
MFAACYRVLAFRYKRSGQKNGAPHSSPPLGGTTRASKIFRRLCRILNQSSKLCPWVFMVPCERLHETAVIVPRNDIELMPSTPGNSILPRRILDPRPPHLRPWRPSAPGRSRNTQVSIPASSTNKPETFSNDRPTDGAFLAKWD